MADIHFRKQMGGDPADVALRAERCRCQLVRYHVGLAKISPEQSMRGEIHKQNVSLSLRPESDVVELAIDAVIC